MSYEPISLVRSFLTTREAEAIAAKLGAEVEDGRGKHKRAKVRLNGQLVGQFGIRRGSGDLGHDHIPRQIGATNRQALDLARCPLSKEEFITILVKQGKLRQV